MSEEEVRRRKLVCFLSLAEAVVLADVEYYDYIERGDIEDAIARALFPGVRDATDMIEVKKLFDWLISYKCFDPEDWGRSGD